METTKQHTDTQLDQTEVQGHLVVASGLDADPTLRNHIEQTLSNSHHTYDQIQGAPTPVQIAELAQESGAHGIIYLVGDVSDRRSAYRLVAYLRRIGWHLPVMLTGPAVDPEYANILALPQHGQLYRGGIYYCEDAFEITQVLKQIILYTPPPQEHDHGDEDPFSCSSCSSCGDACPINN
ncbi:MAG: hypothetical protein P1S60_08860 [Anaerolineae bacterium]|nr:hypothetical protein [Anaerolineae bacterium]